MSSNPPPSGAGAPSISAPADDAPEVEIVQSRKIACDGSEGALGHPRIWLTIPAQGFIDCGYCDKRYVLAEGADAH